jgi:hypothetical protein
VIRVIRVIRVPVQARDPCDPRPRSNPVIRAIRVPFELVIRVIRVPFEPRDPRRLLDEIVTPR